MAPVDRTKLAGLTMHICVRDDLTTLRMEQITPDCNTCETLKSSMHKLCDELSQSAALDAGAHLVCGLENFPAVHLMNSSNNNAI